MSYPEFYQIIEILENQNKIARKGEISIEEAK